MGYPGNKGWRFPASNAQEVRACLFLAFLLMIPSHTHAWRHWYMYRNNWGLMAGPAFRQDAQYVRYAGSLMYESITPKVLGRRIQFGVSAGIETDRSGDTPLWLGKVSVVPYSTLITRKLGVHGVASACYGRVDHGPYRTRTLRPEAGLTFVGGGSVRQTRISAMYGRDIVQRGSDALPFHPGVFTVQLGFSIRPRGLKKTPPPPPSAPEEE